MVIGFGNKRSNSPNRNFSNCFVMPMDTFTAKVLRLAKILVKGKRPTQKKGIYAKQSRKNTFS